MNFVQRLLIRDDIDALELDLARARERDPNSIPAIREEIARLERMIDPSAQRRAPRAEVESAGDH